jgi:hypothetical protein
LLLVSTPKFLVNQPDLFQEIIPILQRLSRDREAKIRLGVVKAINKATKLNLNVLQHSALFDILKRGIYDKNVSIQNTNCVCTLIVLLLLKALSDVSSLTYCLGTRIFLEVTTVFC